MKIQKKEVKKQFYAIVQETKPKEETAKVKNFGKAPNHWEKITVCFQMLAMRWTLR